MSDDNHSGQSANSPADIAREAKMFLHNAQTLQLATINDQGDPHASYTPFVVDDQLWFGILTSRLAKHTSNLLNNSRCSVILIQDESKAHSPFARQRLSFLCEVRAHTRDSEYFRWLNDAMEKKFGAIARQIAQLPDFVAFQLKPLSAEYVKGFGSAWRFKDSKLEEASLIKP